MHASRIQVTRIGLLVLAMGTAACNQQQQDPPDSARRPRSLDDDPVTEMRRGVEPAPARGEDNDLRAGQQVPEDRERAVEDARARIRELDPKLQRLREQLQARGEPMSEKLEEERRVIDRQLDELVNAPEDDWKQPRDRLAHRIDELSHSLTTLLEPEAEKPAS